MMTRETLQLVGEEARIPRGVGSGWSASSMTLRSCRISWSGSTWRPRLSRSAGLDDLLVPVGPGYRPEKLRLRAASVVATLTKNNPPAQVRIAQTEFSTSGGRKALLDAALGCDNRGVAEDGNTATSSSPSSSRLSFALSERFFTR
ncbi:unnamed protein product [Ascophyllum nodosum]